MKYHFEPEKGWINDPNGLVFFRGRYHAFFQHNPYAAHWDRMHWGHAVSDDLITWEELPIALSPDEPYEDDGGCFSGSAIVGKDGKLYLFYTSVSHKLGQTQSVAVSDDGLHFEKYSENPVISACPIGAADFRDPKVTFIDGRYYMVCGSGKDGAGKILLFTSEDLLEWIYVGVLFESAELSPVAECPDFFKLGDRYLLMYSLMGKRERAAAFVVGRFDGERLTAESIQFPEYGPHFYAPQTFSDGARRILIAWMYSWDKKPEPGAVRAGSFTIPRELSLVNGAVHTYPIAEARGLLADIGGGVELLRDEGSVEIFVNRGERSATVRL